ncbi:hypothetical protein SPRG_14272 [Saprolegnia parasitica CBS 223.65]|uniref:Uncharacterized protein n=1 Tax=Saprolegnia parasitica (strain CBS 223.65) TaxID=695850 RepID=A0A067BPS4_SAPPC|nr:hypothetical protein SPRG_14272 [Saprolegnia parasitica CBS 223.65]KDO20514.1 hypothetical protein SPRG_14272 [Saprolegnia parasitica CBS 223.65]|eukprot:XP_012208776.1 hypothetical protein SPRG_14272 [Saprolegnia parasitica CBS 223.65]
MWATIVDGQPLVLALAGPLTQLLPGVLDAELQFDARNREEPETRFWADAFGSVSHRHRALQRQRGGLDMNAACRSHRQLLRRLIDQKRVFDFGYIDQYQRDGMAMNVAAKDGHLEVLQRLHDGGAASCTTAAMDEAAVNGHLHVIQWLEQHRTDSTVASTQATETPCSIARYQIEPDNRSQRSTYCA